MSKVKVKKQSTFIDMTAMSDVTVLLLTFFMLTATFLPKEPVQVITPASVSETKIPEANVMTILIDPKGRVFLNLNDPEHKEEVLKNIGKDYNLNFTKKQMDSFYNLTSIGVPIKSLVGSDGKPGFLDLTMIQQDEILKNSPGVPTDTILSANNQLAVWVKAARNVNENLQLAIKADQGTPYLTVKNVFSTLQDLKENRYSLVTTLRGMPEGY
ncbi:biopolymer transport protein ExbD [Dysgonomonas sp. PH5-45]|uniref:ExbD/TolR family protein n=1 Tax=unclassified Dysgonomonas TaxID=2630389 RepID=UPI002473410F|nr:MULTISPECIES: biopolymer transporter ExbD [unclassified Dysgonomonas]MDH6354001.1 biopolymer transport protein ExbD [Dysgonomonas sp. PH5-45]MDH6386903.1 biopolymer transport protein ExbD [Dysgonomonas sp. PH5-37]